MGSVMKAHPALLIPLLGVLLTAPVLGATEDLSASLGDCARTEDARARLRCYDDLARSLGLATAAAASAEMLVVPPAAQSSVNEAASRSAPQAAAAPAAEQPAERKATVRGIARTAYGKLVLTLDNGETWEQIDSTRLSVREADIVQIRPAASGSFLLRKEGSGPNIRVRLVN